MRLRRRSSLAVLAVAATGTAGCVMQPWQLPDPYGSGSGSGASYYSSGSSVYGYGSSYGYGYGNPYYYSYRQGIPYPGHGYYYSYPSYPGHYCWDNDRDGRCDNRSDQDDDDHDHGGGSGGDDDGAGGKGRDGSPPRLGERPVKEGRRYYRQVEPSGSLSTSGTVSSPAVIITPPAARSVGGKAPALRTPPRGQPPASAPPRAESRRASPEAQGPARREGGAADTPKGPRDDAVSNRRPLR